MNTPPPIGRQDDWTSQLRATVGTSGKSWWTAIVLSGCLGMLGVDRMYLGYPLLGTAKLATCGGDGIWWVADFLWLLFGRITDGDGKVLKKWSRYGASNAMFQPKVSIRRTIRQLGNRNVTYIRRIDNVHNFF